VHAGLAVSHAATPPAMVPDGVAAGLNAATCPPIAVFRGGYV